MCFDPTHLTSYKPADFAINSIGESADVDLSPPTKAAEPAVERVRETA